MSPVGAIQLIDEPTYSFRSNDNPRAYPLEQNLSTQARPTSIHGVLVCGEPVAVVASDGGATGVHEHSAVFSKSSLYIAVGDSIVSLNLCPVQVKWSRQVDPATCLGIYFDERHNALITHGELEIVRLSEDGSILWCASGADTFTEGFSLHSQFIEAVDFNGQTYRFEYESGSPSIV